MHTRAACCALVVAVVALLLTACGAAQPPLRTLDTTTNLSHSALDEWQAPATYRIGIHTEVTGAGAQIGDLSVRAARLALEEINAAGGVDGVQLELVVRDCRSDVQTSLAQYHEAIRDDALVALLGPVKSAYAVPMMQAHRGNALPLFIGATNTTLTEQGSTSLFRMRPSIKVTAAAMVALGVGELGAKRVGIIYDSDPHGSNGAQRIAAELRARGITPAKEIQYRTATTEYDPMVRDMIAGNVDTVFVYGTNPTDIGQLLRAIRYRNRAITIITSPGGSSVVTHNVANDAQDGIYVAIDSLFGATPRGAHFEQAFRARFDLEPDTYVAWYYDAVHLIAATLPTLPPGANLADAIRTTQHVGAQGAYRFDAAGEGLHQVVLTQMRNGQPHAVGTYSAAGLVAAPAFAPGGAP